MEAEGSLDAADRRLKTRRSTPVLSRSRWSPAGASTPLHPAFFTGYRTELSGQMRLMRFDARSIARALTS